MTTSNLQPPAEVETEGTDGLIVADPHRPGRHNARVVDGPPVWLAIGALDRTGGDEAAVAREWGISMQALRAAIRYYERHRALIDAKLLLEREEHLA